MTVTGTTAGLPQAPGLPGDLAVTTTPGAAALTWSAPTPGGAVTGYRLWRQTGEAAFAVVGSDLAASALGPSFYSRPPLTVPNPDA